MWMSWLIGSIHWQTIDSSSRWPLEAEESVWRQNSDRIPSMRFTGSPSKGNWRRSPPSIGFERPLGPVPVRGADPVRSRPRITTDQDRSYADSRSRPSNSHKASSNRFDDPRIADRRPLWEEPRYGHARPRDPSADAFEKVHSARQRPRITTSDRHHGHANAHSDHSDELPAGWMLHQQRPR